MAVHDNHTYVTSVLYDYIRMYVKYYYFFLFFLLYNVLIYSYLYYTICYCHYVNPAKEVLVYSLF